MRRLIIGCAAVAALLTGGALAASTAVEATTAPPAPAPMAQEAHPIVGSWLLAVEEFPDDAPSLVRFHADGTYQEANSDGASGIGSWEATGPNSVNLTFMSILADDEGPSSMQTIRAAGEVSADGQTFTAEFTLELTGEGFPAGEYGPSRVTATRINVEPMGTPVGSLEDLLAQFEEGTTPAGSEALGTTPVGTTPAVSEPVETSPTGTEPVDTTPTVTEPAGTTPVDATVPATTG